MTPAQEAKQYASDSGFDIKVVGRRYSVWKSDELVITVSGYPAALHAMKKYINDNRQCELILEDTICASTLIGGARRKTYRYRAEVWYSDADKDGIRGFVSWKQSYEDAIKFLRQHISGPRGKLVTAQKVIYVEFD